jgi:hypothetical protein
MSVVEARSKFTQNYSDPGMQIDIWLREGYMQSCRVNSLQELTPVQFERNLYDTWLTSCDSKIDSKDGVPGPSDIMAVMVLFGDDTARLEWRSDTDFALTLRARWRLFCDLLGAAWVLFRMGSGKDRPFRAERT